MTNTMDKFFIAIGFEKSELKLPMMSEAGVN